MCKYDFILINKIWISFPLDFDITIIGSGVVGLAIGRSLVTLGKKICLIEKNISFGLETSSRNSEVIHSGIYYPKNSLKSSLCIQGNHLIYQYCEHHNVKYIKSGKLIIANNKREYSELIKLKTNAELLNINHSLLDKKDVKRLEPMINAKHAIHINSSGVIDSHAFMRSMFDTLNDYDTTIVFKTKVTEIDKISKGYMLKIKNPDNTFSSISSKIVINCSGLSSNQTSSSLKIKDDDYKTHFWKGSYFYIRNKNFKKIKHLIYPTPDYQLSGLGIHLTKDSNGRVKLGPDSEYLGTTFLPNFSVNEQKRLKFFQQAKKYLPSLKIEDLEPDYSGIRPKLQAPNQNFRDFVIKNEYKRGFKNFINLIGIESPGLTSCLAIGEYVKNNILWN